jgi:hypothetical protein
MKTIALSLACFVTLASQAFAAQPNYKCIADSLQAVNSDIYVNLTPAEIDELLAVPSSIGHDLVVATAERCEAKLYQCIADSMQAVNSDIYFELKKDEVDAILSNPSAIGHNIAVRADQDCRKN